MTDRETIRVARAALADLLAEIASLQQQVPALMSGVLSLGAPPAALGDMLTRLAALQADLARLFVTVARLTAGSEPEAAPQLRAEQPETTRATPATIAQHDDGSQAEAIPAQPSTLLTVPLVLRQRPGVEHTLPVNGLDLRTGNYLLDIDADGAAALARASVDPAGLRQLHLQKQRSQDPSFGLVTGYREDDLADTRWAVVVHVDESAELLRALTPLIQLRAEEQGITLNSAQLQFKTGETCGAWYGRVIGSPEEHRQQWMSLPPVLTVRGVESERDRTVSGWLARHHVSIGPVDPKRGVPFYLMIAARPGPLTPTDTCYISTAFQYELDLFWGAGRLCFTDLGGQHVYEAYTRYAEQVVAFERNARAAESLGREIAYFATRHPDDLSTQLSADELVLPLYQASVEALARNATTGLQPRLFLADGRALSQAPHASNVTVNGKADIDTLSRLLRSSSGQLPPALLFAATHGAGLPGASSETILRLQGALITQDGSPHHLSRAAAFAGEDLEADATITGMIAVLLACYGAGSPARDDFVFLPDGKRPAVAPFPFIARLPQELLKRGALAVFGHIDRAWTYTFRGVDGVASQTQSFQDVLTRLAMGKRAGFATDQFNTLQAGFGLMFGDELENIRFGKRVDSLQLSRLWMARNDARNYALLGDPAVRLPFGLGERP